MVLTQGGSNGEAARNESPTVRSSPPWPRPIAGRSNESGEYASLEGLAAANGVDRTYVGRILRLTSLAPEIVERILDGNDRQGISLARSARTCQSCGWINLDQKT